jgi:hypothetical protein
VSEQSNERPETENPTEPMADAASRYSQIAQERLEANKERAAKELERAAESIREGSAQASAYSTGAGNQFADSMDRTADYLHEHSTGEIWGGVEQYVRRHRAVAIAGGVSAAFLIAMILHKSPAKEAR